MIRLRDILDKLYDLIKKQENALNSLVGGTLTTTSQLHMCV